MEAAPKRITDIQELKASWTSFKESLKSHKKLAIIGGSVFGILSWWTTGAFTQMVMEDEVYFGLLDCIVETIMYPASLLLWGAICLAGALWGLKFYRLFHKDYYVDEHTGVKIAKDDDTYGSSHWMTPSEKAKYLVMDKDPDKVFLPILGVDKKSNICARKPIRFTNDNRIIFGPPGSGKSISIINNDVFQAIKMGESIIVVDTKGAVFKDTSYVAEMAGYDVKIFNTKVDEVQYSDACDILANVVYDNTLVGRNKAKLAAASIANTIMENSLDANTKKDVWFRGAKNLLRAMILVVKWDKTIKEEDKKFKKVYQILIDQKNYQNLEATYSDVITQDHPAREAWNTYMGMAPVVKESCYGGLMDALSFMESDIVKEILSNEEISFVNPGIKKCAYFIVISDNDRTNNVLAALFIEQLFRALTAYADSMEETGEMRLPVTVNFEIDEAKQVGKIPMFVEKLSSVRARGINITSVYQDLSQIQQLYPDEEWRTVISDCTTMIILKIGNDPAFAQYVSDRLGDVTYFVTNMAYQEDVADVLQLHPEYRKTQGKGARPLMTPSELQGEGEKGLGDDELLVIINGAGALRLDKYMYWLHPYYKYLHLDDPRTKRFTKHHKPTWSIGYEDVIEGQTGKSETQAPKKNVDEKTGMKTISLGGNKDGDSQSENEQGRPERKVHEENVNGRKVITAKSLRH